MYLTPKHDYVIMHFDVVKLLKLFKSLKVTEPSQMILFGCFLLYDLVVTSILSFWVLSSTQL